MALLLVTAGNEASLRTTIAGAAVGDIVQVPSGTYALTAVATITKGITIVGNSGAAGAAGGTIVTVNGARNAFTIDNSAATIDGIDISDLTITGTGGAVAGIGFIGTTGKKLNNTHIKKVTISGFQDGINLKAFDQGAAAMVFCILDRVTVTTCSRWGITLENGTMTRLVSCHVTACDKIGIRLLTCLNANLSCCATEGNNVSLDTLPENGPQCLIKLCHGFTCLSHDCEGLPVGGTATKIGITVSNCTGGVIAGCNVASSTLNTDSRGIYAMNSTKGVEVFGLKTFNITMPLGMETLSHIIGYMDSTNVRIL